MIKKSQFESLDEGALRALLMQLFPEMGYQDVCHYHGGALEQGKDITMWRSIVLGRENVVALVKTGRITGQANTRKGSAGEVFMQINQAFGDQYIDPSGKRRQAHRVLVISNGVILKEARYSLESALKPSGLHGSVEYWDGERVWKLIETHLGAHTAIPRIQDLRELLSASNDFYSFDIFASGTGTRLIPREKYPGASQDCPVSVTLTAKFPNDSSGRARLNAFKTALQGRASITLSEGEIGELRFSEPFTTLFGPSDQLRTSELTITPAPVGLGSFRGRLVAVSAEGNRGALEGLVFQRFRKGDVIYVETPPEPFGICLAVGPTGSLTIDLQFESVGKNAKLFLEWLQFQSALQPGSTLSLADLDTGRVAQLPVQEQVLPEVDPLIAELAKRLVEIQERSGVLFSIPDEVGKADLAVAREVCAYFQPEGAVLPGITLHVSPASVSEVMNALEQAVENLAFRTNGATRELLGVSIALPPAMVYMPKPRSTVPANDLLAQARETPLDGVVDVSLVPSTDDPFRIYFEGWSIPRKKNPK